MSILKTISKKIIISTLLLSSQLYALQESVVVYGKKMAVDYIFKNFEDIKENKDEIFKNYKEKDILKGLVELHGIYSKNEIPTSFLTLIKNPKNKKIKIFQISDFYAYYVPKYRSYAIKYKDNKIDYINEKEIRRLSNGQENFENPVEGKYWISSNYGTRVHPILKHRKFHNGVDFAGNVGTPIKSISEGVVVKKVNNHRLSGNYIVIKHKNGLKSYYLHLNGFAKNLKKGSKIEDGQIIGYLGNTGRSTGPHLHFSMKKNGRWVNPRHYLNKNNEPLLRLNTKLVNNRQLRTNIKNQIKKLKENNII